MRFVFKSVAAAAMFLLAANGVLSANAPAAHRVGKFDFGYEVSGDFRARPVQVFDDGVGKTYFQFRPGEPIPVVLVGAGQSMLLPRPEGPYFVVDGIARDYTLVMGLSRGRAVHFSITSGVLKPQDVQAQPAAAGSNHPTADQSVLVASAGALPEGSLRRVSYAAASPESRGDWSQGSYATPLRGDAIRWESQSRREATVAFAVGDSKLTPQMGNALRKLAALVGSDTRIELLGVEDESMKEGLADKRALAMREVLERAGVPARNISIRQPRDIPVSRAEGKTRVVEATVRWFPVQSMPMPQVSAPSPAPQAMAAAKPAMSEETIKMLLARGLISQAQATAMASLALEQAAPVPQAPKAVGQSAEWDLRRQDGSVSAALSRWAKRAGHELVWDTAIDAPLNGEMVLQAANFREALAKAMEGLQRAGYPLRARVYSDKVVRVYAEEATPAR